LSASSFVMASAGLKAEFSPQDGTAQEACKK
jgi:hypothetical protein